ncbi:GAF and ANTAR domain-containing protein [Quadrisphaera sp. KR29]|uniref:GAF and ANTAR domain-containing protein n=1 Tax=Quadrisphaera sp. KR29 TaxID=3461391 RepID=UPI004044712F
MARPLSVTAPPTPLPAPRRSCDGARVDATRAAQQRWPHEPGPPDAPRSAHQDHCPSRPPTHQHDQLSTAGSATGTGGDDLAEQLADTARSLQGESSSQAVLDRVVALAVSLVPGADTGSISLVRARRVVASAAWTAPVARHLDDLQTEVGEGPCLDAVFTQLSTRVDDLAAEADRWPALARRAGEVDVASVLSLRLFVPREALGALNLHSTRRAAFSEASERVGRLLAAHTAVALAAARTQENLQRGLAHRDVIGQAKGILMAQHRITADQAFAVLAQLSQDLNRKLYEIAADLAATGELPRR